MDSTHADTTQRDAASAMTLEEAASITRSGDVWLFTGRKLADRAIRAATNSPVNHVAMVLAIDDLPPLLWHAELGRSMADVWTGELQRGAQLHRLTEAADTWVNRYGQRAFFRQLDPIASVDMENAALAVVQELSGRRFPTTLGLVGALAQGASPAQRVARGHLLRRTGGAHLPADGAARRHAAAELVRPGPVLERRQARSSPAERCSAPRSPSTFRRGDQTGSSVR